MFCFICCYLLYSESQLLLFFSRHKVLAAVVYNIDELLKLSTLFAFKYSIIELLFIEIQRISILYTQHGENQQQEV